MSCTSLQSTESVGNGTPGVVVEVTFDITPDDSSKGPHQVVDLAWSRYADGVRDTNPRYSNLVYGTVNAEQIDKIAPKAVLGAESDLLPRALNITLGSISLRFRK